MGKMLTNRLGQRHKLRAKGDTPDSSQDDEPWSLHATRSQRGQPRGRFVGENHRLSRRSDSGSLKELIAPPFSDDEAEGEGSSQSSEGSSSGTTSTDEQASDVSLKSTGGQAQAGEMS